MPTTPLPVTVAATRRARPDRGDDLEAWAASLCSAAAEFPGQLRSDVRRRRVRGAAELTVAVTFDSAAAASAWEDSPERAAVVARGDALTEGEPAAAALILSGPAQPRWRASLIVWAGLFPFALALNVLAAAPLAALPVLPRTLLSTALLVPLAVYVGIPAVHAALGKLRRRQ
jgi:antibiotic biosynthesis monooxygenase (ABM) superfamily enzyme